MLELNLAFQRICENVNRLNLIDIEVESSVGFVLAEDIYSPLDMPPFNKSAMDGYAIVYSEKFNDQKFTVENLIQAGDDPLNIKSSTHCSKIMTGAALPDNCDTVIEVELAEEIDGLVGFTGKIKKGRNVCYKGEDIKIGEKLFSCGKTISVADIALLATIGRDEIKVYRKPEVAIINTGGEIIEPGTELISNKIYNSNGPQLKSLLARDKVNINYIGIIPDEKELLSRGIKEGLESDLLLLSGGVSMGDYDLVPSILKENGVKEIFHNVKIKPGKPLFFGVHQNGVVIGIPGNPVSNFLAYNLFIKTVINIMSGKSEPLPNFIKGEILSDFRHKSGRKNFVVSKYSEIDGKIYSDPVKSNGSADVNALSKSDCFTIIPADVEKIEKGSIVEIFKWE
ncbi:MAG: molybdopterin molybdotransferase MoeA [Candidatus Delongbacteria bacterium]|nr:molybdopterin molybdotransferase MoeA [Candidatus Delongbacteria bacterium]MBN2835467.1 molybdopterin molybdotransferase MoeA [Candidatus Delongbacteria bacterium]